jgi:DNA-binding sugar fermentation-stimulating protein
LFPDTVSARALQHVQVMGGAQCRPRTQLCFVRHMQHMDSCSSCVTTHHGFN